jgi:hypothetical protein
VSLLAAKISPVDNHVNIVRLDCECLKWIPFGSESVIGFSEQGNERFVFTEGGNLAIGLKLWNFGFCLEVLGLNVV